MDLENTKGPSLISNSYPFPPFQGFLIENLLCNCLIMTAFFIVINLLTCKYIQCTETPFES